MPRPSQPGPRLHRGTEPLWTITDVAAYLKVSVRTARDLVARPGFPPRIRVSPQVHRWEPDAVRAWVKVRQDVAVDRPRRGRLNDG